MRVRGGRVDGTRTVDGIHRVDGARRVASRHSNGLGLSWRYLWQDVWRRADGQLGKVGLALKETICTSNVTIDATQFNPLFCYYSIDLSVVSKMSPCVGQKSCWFPGIGPRTVIFEPFWAILGTSGHFDPGLIWLHVVYMTQTGHQSTLWTQILFKTVEY